MSRYYPGFLAAFFIVLLRIAIGWHFLYEGAEKFTSTFERKEPFSAEIYLRNATGPLAPFFRGMLPDADGRALLDATKLKAAWETEVIRINQHYSFTKEQQIQARKMLDENLRWLDYWFDDPENDQKRKKYEHDLAQVEQTEQNPQALSYEKERASDARRSLDADRRSLTQPLLDRTGSAARRGRQARHTGPAEARGCSRNRVDQPRRAQLRDDFRADRDGYLLDGRVSDAAGGAIGRGLPGHDLPLDAPLARVAPQPEGRGSLLDRQQEPDRADRLPRHRHDSERALDRF